MSSILSTQNRHIFFRRKYCFLPITALSPPVGRDEPLMGLPPLVSAIFYSLPSVDSAVAAGGAPGAACPVSAGRAGMAGAAGAAGTAGDAIGIGAGRRAARLSRAF